MRDYEYICNHPEEYTEERKAAEECVYNDMKLMSYFPEMKIAQPIVDRSVEIQFHINLLKSGKESIPKKCLVCPMLSSEISEILGGQLTYSCDINSKMFVGDWLFPLHMDDRPDWCPLNKYFVS